VSHFLIHKIVKSYEQFSHNYEPFSLLELPLSFNQLIQTAAIAELQEQEVITFLRCSPVVFDDEVRFQPFKDIFLVFKRLQILRNLQLVFRNDFHCEYFALDISLECVVNLAESSLA
jgi:hypothetical protein